MEELEKFKPEESQPEAEAETFKERETREKLAEDILKSALEETEKEDELKKAEEEALREKEEKESYERKKEEALEYYEKALQTAQQDGMFTFTAMETAQRIREKGESLGLKQKEELIKEALGYLRDKGHKDLNLEFNFKEFVERNTWFHTWGSREEYLNSRGAYPIEMKGPFVKENYFKTMEEYLRNLDQRWPEKEDANELSAILTKANRQTPLKHLEGFGIAALDHGDIESAVKAFILGGQIENPEFAKKVAEKIKEMMESEDPKVRIKAQNAKELLKDYLEKKENKE